MLTDKDNGMVDERIQIASMVDKNAKNVLDLGTGSGLMAFRLRENGFEVTTVDNDPEILTKARQAASENGIETGIDYVVSDAAVLPFADASFDAVVIYNLFHHIENADEVIAEAKRVLKVGGQFLAAELNGSGREIIAEMHKKEGKHHEQVVLDVDHIQKRILRDGYTLEISNMAMNIVWNARNVSSVSKNSRRPIIEDNLARNLFTSTNMIRQNDNAVENTPGILGARFRDAVGFALLLHSEQTRKLSEKEQVAGIPKIPYAGHLLAVASMVIGEGGSEDAVIAALLHDAVEDQGGQETLGKIRMLYGEKVAEYVLDLTDTDVTPKPPWKERKVCYLAHLQKVDGEVLLISLADKVHNLRSIYFDLQRYGESAWERFNAPKDEILWYYQSLNEILAKKLGDIPLVNEFKRIYRSVVEEY